MPLDFLVIPALQIISFVLYSICMWMATHVTESSLSRKLSTCAEKASCSIPYQLATPGSLQVGRKIVMVGYPLAWDQESQSPVEEPYIGHGRVSVLDGNRAGGSYDGSETFLPSFFDPVCM